MSEHTFEVGDKVVLILREKIREIISESKPEFLKGETKNANETNTSQELNEDG